MAGVGLPLHNHFREFSYVKFDVVFAVDMVD